MSKIHEIIDQFKNADLQETIDLLLDYSEDLPELPERYLSDRDKELNRVHECETPVYIWIEINDDLVDIFADVPPESPTVRGLVSILINAFNGLTPSDIESAPTDLLTQLGLVHKLGTRRMYGLSAVYQRIRNEVNKKAFLQ